MKPMSIFIVNMTLFKILDSKSKSFTNTAEKSQQDTQNYLKSYEKLLNVLQKKSFGMNIVSFTHSLKFLSEN